MSKLEDRDEWLQSRPEEEQAALRVGALSWPDRKLQRWGLPSHWREAGPFDWTRCEDVEVIAGKVSGVPILVKTRMPADSVLQHYEWGESAEEIAETFGLDVRQVNSVLHFVNADAVAA